MTGTHHLLLGLGGFTEPLHLCLNVMLSHSFNFIQINILFPSKKSSAKSFIYLLTWRTSPDHTVFEASLARGPSTEPTILSQDFWFGYDTALTKLISVSGVWHVLHITEATIFCLVCLYPDRSCTRISQPGNGTFGHLDPPYSVWLVWVCWTSQIHSSPSVALLHVVHDWDPPSAAWFGWIYWTSALMLKFHAVSAGYASVKGVSLS